jgi:hypothetical protein
MKKLFLYALALIVVGNLLITSMEKIFLNSDAIQVVQKNILTATNSIDVASIYPASLLFTKMMIWIVSFAILSIWISFIKIDKKKLLQTIVIGFYLVGCLANVFIIPHPLWFVMATVAIVIVPFVVIPEFIKITQNGFCMTDMNITNKKFTPTT